MSEVRLVAEPRTEFGKGAARRTRRAGKIPAVLYGHGAEVKHVSLPALEFARVIRQHGSNAVLDLDMGSLGRELVLTKVITTHPLRDYIEHVDLLLVKRGEKVTVEVSVVITGDAAPGTLVTQELTQLQVEADALSIPDNVEVSVAGAEAGTQIHASDIQLPKGVTLATDAEALVINVVTAPTAEQMEGTTEAPAADADAEGAEA